VAAIPPTLRPAGPDDRAFVHEVHAAALRGVVEPLWGWDPEQQRAFADATAAHPALQIVEVEGAAVGYLAVEHDPARDFIAIVALLPAVQGRGIGTCLIRHCQAAAAARGVPLELSVLDGNRARELYLRLGFTITHVVPPRTRMAWIAPGSVGRYGEPLADPAT
jgi:GNAT superfamily N-acetyltransferase